MDESIEGDWLAAIPPPPRVPPIHDLADEVDADDEDASAAAELIIDEMLQGLSEYL